MNHIKSICLIICMAISQNLNGQPAQKLVVGSSILNLQPTAKDSITFLSYARLTSISNKYYCVLSLSNDTFKVSYCIQKGFGTAPSSYQDTFNVGLLTAGSYTLLVEGNLSNDSCVNKGFYASDFTTFTVRTSTTLPSIYFNSGFQVTLHPNPASGYQILSIKTTKPEQLTIRLTDLTGRAVRQVWAVEIDAGEHSIPIDISSLAPGLYFYRVRIGEREEVLKMVKH